MRIARDRSRASSSLGMPSNEMFSDDGVNLSRHGPDAIAIADSNVCIIMFQFLKCLCRNQQHANDAAQRRTGRYQWQADCMLDIDGLNDIWRRLVVHTHVKQDQRYRTSGTHTQ